MRKFALMAALAATALAGPAFARDDSWYVGIEGGVMKPRDTKFDVGPSPFSPVGGRTTVEHKLGYDVDAVLGYDFGMIRLEEEITFKSARVKSITTGPARTPANAGGIGAPPGVYPDASGKTTALGVMVNALFDFGDDDGLSFYAGGGAGIAGVKLENYNVSGDDFIDFKLAKRFAWQAIAGVRYAVGPNLDVGVKYRYYTITKVRPYDVATARYDGKWRSHSALLSLIYNIGGRAEAAPPPPPPPP
ncbi:outer membrane protein, partial [Sphingomonas sp. SRS2]|uniref:outer membrane protein n=1 Tax=Sphingomonas sp. SRS2 TaxID=133190 RepID=UPI00061843E4